MQTALGESAPLQGEALVDNTDNVWLPFDMPHRHGASTGWTRLSRRREVRHAGRRAFHWRASAGDTLHILNGMGVTLGDSVIGMNALAWLKDKHPALRIHLYRTPHAPPFVERLYQLAGHIIEPVIYLPRPLSTMPQDIVDLSDFLHWPSFATDPMVDFFIRGVGIALDEVPESAKANRWLSRISVLPAPAPWADRDYVLFCDQASTPLRTVPAAQASAMVDRIWQRYRLPVLGFHPIAHPHYHDISAQSRDLDEFMAWIKGARGVIGTDSSAIHLAAGFDVPTLAVFVSMDPQLRARDYPHCRVLDLRTALTDGLHESSDPAVLEDVRRMWQDLVERGELPWPDLAPMPGH